MDLVDWGNKAFKGPWREQKQVAITWALEKLIKRYNVTHLNIKVPHRIERYKPLMLIRDDILQLASNNGIKTKIWSLQKLLSANNYHSKTGKRAFLTKIALKHPFVTHEYTNNDEVQVYYEKVLEAIAVAETGARQ
ncbi:MAG TPA: hypothetical protein VFW78_04710 [Bacteroidia bacterium]|nr:hypothetical protein [Bacteroidia bacterium]